MISLTSAATWCFRGPSLLVSSLLASITFSVIVNADSTRIRPGIDNNRDGTGTTTGAVE